MVSIMLSRKIQEVKGSFYVYLPKEWCEKEGLKNGSELKIQELEDGSLLVIPAKKEVSSVPKQGHISADNIETMQVLLLAAYITGAEQILLTSPSEISIEFREEIEKIVRNMVGMEIVKETDKTLLVRDISGFLLVEPILQRMFTVVSQVLKSVVRILRSGDAKEAAVIVNRDDDVDRYNWLMQRIVHLVLENPSLSRKINIRPVEGFHYSYITRYIERIADHAVAIAHQVLEKGFVSEEASQLAEKAANMYDTLLEVISGKSITKALTIISQRKKFKEELKKMEAKHQEARETIHHIERVIDYCSDISEIVIDQMVLELILNGEIIKC
ncbi:MAG: PhoU domain-containing protein [Candidatus Jordarchaeales archaeon]